MDTLEIINQKIEELNNELTNISQQNLTEKEKLDAQIHIVDEVEKALTSEEATQQYDFSNAISLIESYDYSINNLSDIISDIQNVLQIRTELDLDPSDLALDQSQIITLEKFSDALKDLKVKLEEKKQEMTETTTVKKSIKELGDLKNIFEGKGKRKYFTYDQIKAFYENFGSLDISVEEANELLGQFFKTKNFSVMRPRVEKADINDVIALYKEYINPFPKRFQTMIMFYELEITSTIDFENARKILEFFKQEGILKKFELPALLKITLFGTPEYTIDVAYPKMTTEKEFADIYDKDIMVTNWIQSKKSKKHRSVLYKTRKTNDSGEKESLYSSCHKVTIDEYLDNVRLLKENSYLFNNSLEQDKIDFSDPEKYLDYKVLPNWLIKNNIQLFKLFKLGEIYPISLSCMKGDMEERIHLAVELGLLNPPLNWDFEQMDADIIGNDSFQKNVSKKGISNQTIRNYYARYSSGLYTKPLSEFPIMFSKIKNGYTSFYNQFFSDTKAGQANPNMITEKEQIQILSNKDAINDFIDDNFINNEEQDIDYDKYDTIIHNHNEAIKNGDEPYSYIDSTIFSDPLIQELENNNTVTDTYMVNGESIERKNEYVYMFGDRIISRYKVLHYASILRNETSGNLNRNMLMTAIIRKSYLTQEDYDKISSTVFKKVKTL